MIYAINKRTKEHRVYRHPNDAGFWANCKLVQADADGWIPWAARPGAECPLPQGADCDVRHEDGYIADRVPADQEKWSGVNAAPGCKIVAYRPSLDAEPSEPEAPEWDGEGLPPVGCECNCKRYPSGKKWEDCKVVGHDLTDGFYVAVARVGSEYLGLPMSNFRPIRTLAQRAEEGIRLGIVEALTEAASDGRDVLDDDVCASVIASAIRDGKIPGVKLEDKS